MVNKSNSLKIYLPSNILEKISNLQEKTFLLGNIGRFCSIYRVNTIILYEIGKTYQQRSFDVNLMRDIFSYMNTPQYLRKKLFFQKKTLKFAGILPPLNTPNHPTEPRSFNEMLKNRKPVYRIGFVEEILNGGPVLDIGLKTPITVPSLKKVKKAEVINLLIDKSNEKTFFKVIPQEQIPFYWGFDLKVEKRQIREIIERCRKNEYFIATSVHGVDYIEVLEQVNTPIKERHDISLVFGPRDFGLRDLFKNESEMEEYFDLVVNLFPDTPTKTVRLEESIPAALFFQECLRKSGGRQLIPPVSRTRDK
ncbi:MAG: putative RNA uridine N3 methyltransferase [Promethearchaeota archaeon]